MDALHVAPDTSVSCNQSFKTFQHLGQNCSDCPSHQLYAVCLLFTALICWVPSTPLNRFSNFHPCLVALPESMLTAPFRLLLSQNGNVISNKKQHSTPCRSNHSHPSDSNTHHLPELSRMMDLRHTNSSP